MDLTVIGLGHVGLIDSLVLGSYFHHIIGYDVDKDLVQLLRDGISPFEEPFVQDLLKETRTYVRFTSNIKDAIRPNKIITIAVETDFNEDGTFNLDKYYQALDLIAESAVQDAYIVIRSTVPPGTNRKTKEYLESKCQYKFNVISFKRVYISRNNSPRRIITNEKELEDLLHKYNFEKYYLEDLSVEDQISLFHSAECVVAPHGAGLVNLVYSNSDTTVLEIFPQYYHDNSFYLLADNKKMPNYHYYIADTPNTQNTHPQNEDITVNIRIVEDFLKIRLKA